MGRKLPILWGLGGIGTGIIVVLIGLRYGIWTNLEPYYTSAGSPPGLTPEFASILITALFGGIGAALGAAAFQWNAKNKGQRSAKEQKRIKLALTRNEVGLKSISLYTAFLNMTESSKWHRFKYNSPDKWHLRERQKQLFLDNPEALTPDTIRYATRAHDSFEFIIFRHDKKPSPEVIIQYTDHFLKNLSQLLKELDSKDKNSKRNNLERKKLLLGLRKTFVSRLEKSYHVGWWRFRRNVTKEL